MLDPSQNSFQLFVRASVCVRDKRVTDSVRDRFWWWKRLKCVASVSQTVVLSAIKAEMSCAFESCTSYVSCCVISVCSGWSSKLRVGDRNVSMEQRSEDYKSSKIRDGVLVSVDPDLIKTFLSVFFSLYSLVVFLLVFMWSLLLYRLCVKPVRLPLNISLSLFFLRW